MEVVSRELFDRAQQATNSALKVADELLAENRKLNEILNLYKEQVEALKKLVLQLSNGKELCELPKQQSIVCSTTSTSSDGDR